MEFQGGCYCGGLRYEASGEPLFKGQCHCRECQYVSGGHPNVVLGMPSAISVPISFRRRKIESICVSNMARSAIDNRRV